MAKPKHSSMPQLFLALEERKKLISFVTILITIDRRAIKEAKAKRSKIGTLKCSQDRTRVTASLYFLNINHKTHINNSNKSALI